ncbi:hypothetical protein CCP3SC15_1260014 [Gammaproteobacteria bacterium]
MTAFSITNIKAKADARLDEILRERENRELLRSWNRGQAGRDGGRERERER